MKTCANGCQRCRNRYDAPVRVTGIKARAREPRAVWRPLLQGGFMSTMVRKAVTSRVLTLRKLTERAINDPQRMQDRGRDRGEDAVQDLVILHSGFAADLSQRRT